MVQTESVRMVARITMVNRKKKIIYNYNQNFNLNQFAKIVKREVSTRP